MEHPANERVKSLKRTFLYILLILIGVIAGIVISNVLFLTMGYPLFGKAPDKPAPTAVTNNAELTALAYTVQGYINDRNYPALSRIAHPEFGVVFAPCATVNLSTNKCFQADQIVAFGSDNTVYVWGVQEGTGEPIEMTAADYFAEYITCRDYSCAPIVGVNRIVKSGNALENIEEVFPDVKFVDFHVPSGEKTATEDYGWTSLRLGFEEYEGSLWLTLIMKSKWTV